MRGLLAGALLTLALVASQAEARVTKIEILSTEPAFGGASFGDVGPYDRLIGRVTGSVDPADPSDAIIQDIDLAPKDAEGHVPYSTQIEILRPHDLSRGNRVLMFEVTNRGNKLALSFFHDGMNGSLVDRNNLSAPGDGWFMKQGYTLVWFGWEMDVPAKLGHLGMEPVAARNKDGSSVVGIVRSEIVTAQPTPTLAIVTSNQIQLYPQDTFNSYPTASLDKASSPDGFTPTLTVRRREQDPREPIPDADWSFASCDPGKTATPDETHLCYPKGFEPGRLYELIYRAKDPTVGGLGFAATRDLGAFVRNQPKDEAGVTNPVFRPDNLALIEGSSQSGRMIRSFLALGFNRGEDGKQVFDAAYTHIGGGLMPLNVRFAQPLRAWGEQVDHLYPAYDFPFTYTKQDDPLSGRSQGLFDRCRQTNTCPLLFHVATSLEMWEGRQSLGLTDPLGRSDVADPPEVRTFIMTSTQHGPAALPLPTKAPFGSCQQQPNPNPQNWTMRALLTALTLWARDGVAPPDSVVPRIAEGTLVAPDSVRFPEIPSNAYGGVERPAVSNLRVYDGLHVLDFGPSYRAGDSSGVLSLEPPRVGAASYAVLVPQVDADGNDLGGVRSVFARTPIGTYTGWNVGRKERFENGLCNLQGSFIPFATTRAERLAVGDPRLSLEERYPDKETYVKAFEAGARELTSARLLLSEDAEALVAKARAEGVRVAP